MKRITSKIIRIITAVSMIAAMLVPAAGVNAALGIENELQVSLMAALGIVPGYPSNYSADETVRAEDFFKYASRLTGSGFTDVSSELTEYGLGADDAVKSSKAVKYVLDTVYYGNIVSAYGGSYTAMAAAIGLLDDTGISASSDADLTYNNMVMLFYNALNLDVLERNTNGSYTYGDKTVMEYYLKIYEGEGVVNADNTSVIDGGSTAGKGSVRIGGTMYLEGNTTASKLIGMYVEFYYYDGSDAVIKWIETDASKTESLTVYGNDVTKVSSNIIYYEVGNKSKTAKLDDGYVIIYNGKNVTDGRVGIEAAASPNAEITLIDNNNSGKYNVVILNDYEYYYVDAVTSDTYTVSDYSANTSAELYPSTADAVYVYENGAKTTISAVAAGKMIAVSKSLDSSVIKIEILSGAVSGEITALSSDYMTVSGTSYEISPSYAGDELKTGKYGTFYFDRYGRVVRCAGLKEASSQYGYLLGYYNESNPDGDYYAKIFTAEGTIEVFTVQNSLTLNGTKRTASAAAERIEKNQLITYKVNSSNKITKINTADKNYVGIDTSTDDFSLHFTGSGKYRKNNLCFNSKYMIDSSTPIFVVPQSGDAEDFALVYASSLTNNTTYDISVYDIDDYMCASCVVMKENFTEPENLRSKRSVIITKVYEAVDDENENVIMIEGYRQGSTVSFTVENTSMKDNRGRYYIKDLDRGDVVQIGESAAGGVSAVQLLFKADEAALAIASGTETPNTYWEGGSSVMPDLWVSCGTVTGRSSTVLLVDADGDDTVTTKDPHKFASATNVYIYENGTVSSSSAGEISVGDTVYVHEYQGTLQEVMIIR